MYGVFFGVTILISTVEPGCALDAARGSERSRDRQGAVGNSHLIMRPRTWPPPRRLIGRS
jgi:hypothetical protein